ncbi:hypothetical protein Csa_005588 [Cucumis sativus]|uniref:Uncharacterized protein n=1 Tax=Cucumis sativus TaxID=3659 RepID=A0A0A0KEL7_CUCSA|nr:hypothetical protein Csa_005588 [Cucumis sativus]
MGLEDMVERSDPAIGLDPPQHKSDGHGKLGRVHHMRVTPTFPTNEILSGLRKKPIHV